MGQMKFEIEGLDKLQKRIIEMQKMNEFKKTLAEWAPVAVRDIQAQTYVSFVKGYSKGFTRDSADWKPEHGGLSVVVGVATDYAPYVEYGTRFMEPEPFMQPMIDRQRKELKRRMERLVR